MLLVVAQRVATEASITRDLEEMKAKATGRPR